MLKWLRQATKEYPPRRAPSRKGCVFNGQMTTRKASNERVQGKQQTSMPQLPPLTIRPINQKQTTNLDIVSRLCLVELHKAGLQQAAPSLCRSVVSCPGLVQEADEVLQHCLLALIR